MDDETLKSKNTAGPWERNYEGTGWMVGNKYTHVAAVESGNETDANLIAAAPELFEALCSVLQCVKGGLPITVMTDVDNALAKATGKSPTTIGR